MFVNVQFAWIVRDKLSSLQMLLICLFFLQEWILYFSVSSWVFVSVYMYIFSVFSPLLLFFRQKFYGWYTIKFNWLLIFLPEWQCVCVCVCLILRVRLVRFCFMYIWLSMKFFSFIWGNVLSSVWYISIDLNIPLLHSCTYIYIYIYIRGSFMRFSKFHPIGRA